MTTAQRSPMAAASSGASWQEPGPIPSEHHVEGDRDTSAAAGEQVGMSVLFVCSSGGHLAQLTSAREWWSTQRVRWVTFPTTDAKSKLKDQDVVWAHYPTTRHIVNALRNLGLAVTTLRSARPDVVVSNGAGVAFPFFVVAWLMQIPTVYIEVFDRIESPTLTGRLCRPFTTQFCVQWAEQQRLYPGARLIGHLL